MRILRCTSPTGETRIRVHIFYRPIYVLFLIVIKKCQQRGTIFVPTVIEIVDDKGLKIINYYTAHQIEFGIQIFLLTIYFTLVKYVDRTTRILLFRELI